MKKKIRFGPLLPGEYEIKAVVNGDYGKVEQVKEIDFSDKGASEGNVEFSWSDYYIDLYHWYGDECNSICEWKKYESNSRRNRQCLDLFQWMDPLKLLFKEETKKVRKLSLKKAWEQYEFKLA